VEEAHGDFLDGERRNIIGEKPQKRKPSGREGTRVEWMLLNGSTSSLD
jgi:hypothetical protein